MGFDPSLDSGDPIDIGAADAGVIAAGGAYRHAGVVEGETGGAAPAFAQLPPGQRCVAVPLALCGQVVAVLYADGASNHWNLEP